jgi:hypothetical protein
MTDPTTSNILLAVPTRGSDVGTWDIPVNGNSTGIDGFIGGVQVISASSTPITLTAPSGVVTPTAGPTQSQNAVIRLTGTLTAGITVTLPLPGYLIIENLTTGNFVVQFRAIGSGEVICVDQGAVQHVYNDGTNVRFINLPPVGTYLDVCDAVVPAWISNCTKSPYLNCNGSTFNATTYPYLNTKLGGNVLPDFRGRSAYYLNQGAIRLTSAGAGIDGNTQFATGGNNGVMLNAGQIPSLTSGNNAQGINPPVPFIVANSPTPLANVGSGSGATITAGNGINALTTNSGFTQSITVTYTNSSLTNFNNAAPGIVGGIRLIRAA